MKECCFYDVSLDDAPPVVYNEKMVKARKPHVCCECGEVIERFATYQRSRGLWEGHWFEFKTCHVCAQIRNDFFCSGSISFGELRNGVRDCLEIELT